MEDILLEFCRWWGNPYWFDHITIEYYEALDVEAAWMFDVACRLEIHSLMLSVIAEAAIPDVH